MAAQKSGWLAHSRERRRKRGDGMPWYIVYDITSKEILGEGSQVPDGYLDGHPPTGTLPLDRGLITLASRPDSKTYGWNTATLAYDTVLPPPPTPPMPKLDFMRRFTLQEEAALRSSAKTDGILEVFFRRMENAVTIDVNHPDVVAGLAYIVANYSSTISAERAAEIGA